MKKIRKGEYQYRNYNKKKRSVLILLFVAAIFIQLAARNITVNPSTKNILTVMAILTVLPMANLAAPYIAAFKYKSCEKSIYDKVRLYEENFLILYDLIITSKEQIIPSDILIIHSTGVYIYCTDMKTDTVKAEKFISSVLMNNGINIHVRILKDSLKLMHILETLHIDSDYNNNSLLNSAASCLKSISM